MYDLLAIVNGVSEISLKMFSNVTISHTKVVVGYEVHYILVVFIFVHDYYGVTFVSFGDYSFISN
jgi:hypothetical protein